MYWCYEDTLHDHLAEYMIYLSTAQSFWFSLNLSYYHSFHLSKQLGIPLLLHHYCTLNFHCPVPIILVFKPPLLRALLLCFLCSPLEPLPLSPLSSWTDSISHNALSSPTPPPWSTTVQPRPMLGGKHSTQHNCSATFRGWMSTLANFIQYICFLLL